MSDQRQQILDLLETIDETYWGPEERALIDRALALSREIDDEELEYKVRMRLTASAVRTGDNDSVLSSFAWCLAKHDADPVRFPVDQNNNMADLMWQFKWVIGTLDASPIFTLAQCEAMLDDMEAHYVREGFGLSGVITARFQHAWTTGDLTKAMDLRTLLTSTPRDEHSHCDACGRSELAGFAVEIGEEELGLKLVDEIMEGGFSCGEEPENALGRTLVAKLRAGRMDHALDSHMRSYRLARKNPDNISIVADNMIFCAITGNEARGLAMVERHISWITHDSLNEAGQMDMLTAIGVVLEAVARAGYGDQMVRGADSLLLERFFGKRATQWTVAELVPVVWEAVSSLTSAFDSRNGNDYISGLVARKRDLLNEHYDLPIVSEVFLPPSEPSFVATTPQQWLDLGEVFMYAGMGEEGIDACTQALDGGDVDVTARALQLIVGTYYGLEKPEVAKELLPKRIEALQAQGRTLQAEVETRCGLSIYGARTPDDIAALEAEMERLAQTPGEELADVEVTLADCLMNQEEGEVDQERVLALLESSVQHAVTRPSLQVSAIRSLMYFKANAGDLEEAMEYADQVLASEVSDGCKAAVLTTRARLLGGLERYDEGSTNADSAMKIYVSYSVMKQVVANAVLSSALLCDAGKHEDELARLRYAMREAEQLDMEKVGIKYRLGNALVATGHPHEGVELLWEVLQEEEADDVSPESRAETLQALAQGFEAAKKYGNAVSMYERAADLLEEAEQPVNAANMLRRKGNILREFEVHDDALASLARAWELVQNHDAPGMEVQVLEAYAFAKSASGDGSAVDDIDRAISTVENDPNGPFTWKVADLIDSKGRIFMDLDRREEAVACFLQAADGYAEASDVPSAARAVHFAAQTLAGPLERGEEAVPIFREALARADAAIAQDNDIQGLRNSILVKLAETLEGLGRDAEAAETRALMTDS